MYGMGEARVATQLGTRNGQNVASLVSAITTRHITCNIQGFY